MVPRLTLAEAKNQTGQLGTPLPFLVETPLLHKEAKNAPTERREICARNSFAFGIRNTLAEAKNVMERRKEPLQT